MGAFSHVKRSLLVVATMLGLACHRDGPPTPPNSPTEPRGPESAPCSDNLDDDLPGCDERDGATGEDAEGFEGDHVRSAHRPKYEIATAPEQEACPEAAAKVEMVPIPAGVFRMGCDEKDRSICSRTEYPSRSVQVDSFSIDRHEVTQAAYARCLEARVCTVPLAAYDPRENCTHPVVAVTWDQAVGYCRWKGKRLPTEAEWEKAARGTDGRPFPWGDQPPDCGRTTFGPCGGAVEAVATKPDGASPYGVLGMAGNVREWTADVGPRQGTRVIRGGTTSDGAPRLRVTARVFGDVEVLDARLGLRCAR